MVKLWVDNKVEGPAFANGTVADIQSAIDAGTDIVGDPEYVCEQIIKQVKELGVNYMLCQFYFGDIAHKDAMRSVELNRTHCVFMRYITKVELTKHIVNTKFFNLFNYLFANVLWITNDICPRVDR